MSTATEIFDTRYQSLNEKQKQAVDTIYGPVMVIAGPGTGKTEVLAMRIANLLRSDAQIKPHEILCLTFTDEGVSAMKKRLLQIVGNESHKVQVYTYHGFCNSIIQSHGDLFGKREMEPITELEENEIVETLLSNLPVGHPLRRLKGDLFYDGKNLLNLFKTMKDENWSPQYLTDCAKAYIDSLPTREKFLYKRKYKQFKAGDVKQAEVDTEKEKMVKLQAGASLLPQYEALKTERGRYDYSDMIVWVLKAFAEDPTLLQLYQERFQFILVDEFQDTNGSQNEIIKLLTSFWEAPNIFVVGDDDQCVYEFQGARLKNLMDFYERYKDSIQVIVLKENYRSAQPVIDLASESIAHNQERLIHLLSDLNLDKDITAAHPIYKNPELNIPPKVTAYSTPRNEELNIVHEIKKLNEAGVPYKNIAVLYAQHKQADRIIELMDKKNMPYQVKKPVDVLSEPIVVQILNVLQWLAKEMHQPFSGEFELIKMMHAPWTKCSVSDIARLSLLRADKKSGWPYFRQWLSQPIMLQEVGLQHYEPFKKLGDNIEGWLSQMTNLKLPMLLEHIFTEAEIVTYVFAQPNHFWLMQNLNTFFNFVQDECTRNPSLTLEDFLLRIEKMKLNHIALPLTRVIKQEDGVSFFSAHASKGHEFEHVFLIGLTDKFWEKKKERNTGFTIPDTVAFKHAGQDDIDKGEAARRLFFVAVTRARVGLYLSYPEKSNEDKNLIVSQYVDEVSLEADRIKTEQQEVPPFIIDLMGATLQNSDGQMMRQAQEQVLREKVRNLSLSASALNTYLRCPVSYYFQNVLTIPGIQNDTLSFGTAIHYALEKMFAEMKKSPSKDFPPVEMVLKWFWSSMKKQEGSFTDLQFERRMELGQTILEAYYQTHIEKFVKNVDVELFVRNAQVDGVPLTGKIDKIEYEPQQTTVVDYKTGNPDGSHNKIIPPSEKEPLGSDYWRQIVFYKILLENSPATAHLKINSGRFEFIEPKDDGQYREDVVPIAPEDVRAVKQQITSTYAAIQNQEFNKGCGKEECVWCEFVRENGLLVNSEKVK